MNEKQFDILDIISFMSFIIGIENLQENRIQSKNQEETIKNLEIHLKSQDKLLEDLSKHLKEQDKLLERR